MMPIFSRKAAYSLPAVLLSAGFLILTVAAPLWAMLRYEDGALLWREVLSDGYYRQRLQWTAFQAAFTALLTLLLGLPAGWTLARFEFRGRRLLLRLLMLPFVLPTLVAGMGVLALFGEHGLLWRGQADTPWLLLYGNVFFNLPVAVRSVYQGLRQVPADRTAAVRTLGATPWQCFWLAEWPVLKPWLAGAACLVFLYCFSGFGLALLLGGERYATAEVEIYRLIAYELDMARAAVLVWSVLGTTALAGAACAWFARRSTAAAVRVMQPEKPATAAQRLFLAASLAPLVFCCALPVSAVLFQAASAGGAWRVLWEDDTLAALWNTLRFSACTVAAAAVLGMANTVAARRLGALRALLFLPLMVSPVCLAFGVLLLYPDWSATLPMLLALYALTAYPPVAKDLLAARDSLPPDYAAAARVSGATPFQAACRVTLPLLRPALRRALPFAAAAGIGEFAATLFLSRPEWTTLTTLVYRYLGRVGAENRHKAAVLTLLLAALAAAVFALLDDADDTAENDKAA